MKVTVEADRIILHPGAGVSYSMTPKEALYLIHVLQDALFDCKSWDDPQNMKQTRKDKIPMYHRGCAVKYERRKKQPVKEP